jgi:hypothetical protein
LHYEGRSDRSMLPCCKVCEVNPYGSPPMATYNYTPYCQPKAQAESSGLASIIILSSSTIVSKIQELINGINKGHQLAWCQLGFNEVAIGTALDVGADVIALLEVSGDDNFGLQWWRTGATQLA